MEKRPITGSISTFIIEDTIGTVDVRLKEDQLKDDRVHGFSMADTLNRVDR